MVEIFDLTKLLRLVADLESKQTSIPTSQNVRQVAAIVAILLETPTSHQDYQNFSPFQKTEARDGARFPRRTAMMAYLSEFGLIEALDCLATAPDVLDCTMEDAAEIFARIHRVTAFGATSDPSSPPR